MSLPVGAYRFEADYNDTEFWSSSGDDCAIPGCTSVTITVPAPVTVTYQDSSGNPIPTVWIYAYTGSTYTGARKRTDGSIDVTQFKKDTVPSRAHPSSIAGGNSSIEIFADLFMNWVLHGDMAFPENGFKSDQNGYSKMYDYMQNTLMPQIY